MNRSIPSCLPNAATRCMSSNRFKFMYIQIAERATRRKLRAPTCGSWQSRLGKGLRLSSRWNQARAATTNACSHDRINGADGRNDSHLAANQIGRGSAHELGGTLRTRWSSGAGTSRRLRPPRRHRESTVQSHDFVLLTPRTIITTIMMATIKRAHRPHCCHGMPSHMVQKVAKRAGYVASVVGA
jgi:hypothetical protein